MNAYIVANRDLARYLTGWLEVIALTEEEQAAGVGGHGADSEDGPAPVYLFNATYLYGRVGPQALDAGASVEQLLLAAVLSVYQDVNPTYAGMKWTTQADHVARAFQLAQELGDTEMARRLIAAAIKQGEHPPEGWKSLQAANARNSPAKAAFWDGKMAELAQRELRAAAIFDIAVDFDSVLLDPDRRR